MKRFLFPSLVLCATLASACNPGTNGNNSNGGVNQNAANISQAAGNTNAVMTLIRDPKNKAVMITVSADAAGTPQISVAPPLIHLSKGKGQKLRFYIFDDLDDDLDSTKIEFKTGNPMDSDYTIGPVVSGDADKSSSYGIKAGTTNNKYPYKITVTIHGVGTPITLDPDVEVGN